MTLADVQGMVFGFLNSVLTLLMQPPLFWFVGVALIICTIEIIAGLVNILERR